MLFTEPFFLLFFLPAAVLAFYLVANRLGREAALSFSFVVSLLFYAQWGMSAFAIMLAGTVVNFAVCWALLKWPPEQPRRRAALFWLGQAYNFGTLLAFKYIIPIVAAKSGFDHPLIPIPVGISFYTFQQAVLLVDTYARKPEVTGYFGEDAAQKPARTFLRFGAFHCFFPQLVVGPITYLSEFGAQIRASSFGKPKKADFEVGLTLIVIGMFKKVALADGLGLIADPVFDALRAGIMPSPVQVWTAALAYFAQLYFDFSGYSDMALGIARLFGIRLPINFASPLRASGIADFYRRWHITLTRVINRFLFTPLSLAGTRFAAERRLPALPARALGQWLPLMLNFMVIALWHGATPTFVLFGLIHGAWFVGESEVKRLKAWRGYKSNTPENTRRMVGQTLTFLPLMMTFTLFRSDSLATFGRLLSCLWTGAGAELTTLHDADETLPLVVAAFAVIWLLPNSMELTRRMDPGIVTWDNHSTTPGLMAKLVWTPNLAWAVGMAGLLLASVMFISRKAPFIYMGY